MDKKTSEVYEGGPLSDFSISYEYDTYYRQEATSFLDGTNPLFRHSYTYDEASRLETVNYGDHKFEYDYETYNNLISNIKALNADQQVLDRGYGYDTFSGILYP